jgi:hypothetical protein
VVLLAAVSKAQHAHTSATADANRGNPNRSKQGWEKGKTYRLFNLFNVLCSDQKWTLSYCLLLCADEYASTTLCIIKVGWRGIYNHPPTDFLSSASPSRFGARLRARRLLTAASCHSTTVFFCFDYGAYPPIGCLIWKPVTNHESGDIF